MTSAAPSTCAAMPARPMSILGTSHAPEFGGVPTGDRRDLAPGDANILERRVIQGVELRGRAPLAPPAAERLEQAVCPADRSGGDLDGHGIHRCRPSRLGSAIVGAATQMLQTLRKQRARSPAFRLRGLIITVFHDSE